MFPSRNTQKKNFLSPQRESNPWPSRYRLKNWTKLNLHIFWLRLDVSYVWRVHTKCQFLIKKCACSICLSLLFVSYFWFNRNCSFWKILFVSVYSHTSSFAVRSFKSCLASNYIFINEFQDWKHCLFEKPCERSPFLVQLSCHIFPDHSPLFLWLQI